jgi:sulfotransferase
MKNKIYFVSGLPRSGSTLLINILHQNPNFLPSKSTSGLHDVLFGIRNQYDSLIEHKAEGGGIDYNRLKRILRSTVEAYYDTDKPVIIDKGRGWLSLIEMINFMGISDPKIIVPVRDVSEILASFEKLWRKTTGGSQWNIEKEDYIKSQTVGGRCEMWSRGDQVVGLAYNRLKDALARGHGKHLFILEFDDLTRNPERKLREIYDFLGEEYYNHNFSNVEQVTVEDDAGTHRIPDLHTISKVVKPLPRVAREILGEEVFKKYNGAEFWRSK